jgi:hypothetical protein
LGGHHHIELVKNYEEAQSYIVLGQSQSVLKRQLLISEVVVQTCLNKSLHEGAEDEEDRG